MVLAASESFVLGDGRKPKRRTRGGNVAVETYGYLWGHRRVSRSEDIENIYIDKFDESLSAKRKNSSVLPNEDAIKLKNSIIERWSPHLSFLGDFHTHPFDSLTEIEKFKGWRFSEQDINSFSNDDPLWDLSDGSPLMLVMAVAPVERVHYGWGRTDGAQYRWRFDIGQLRFWLTAHIGYLDSDSKRCSTHKKVILDLDTILYNESGARLEGADNDNQ